MTSTSFNIGLSTEKNSSRVLRPPGGGHSDIFGLRDNQNELVTPSKKKNQPQSTIGSCFTMVEEESKPANEKPVETTINGEEAITEKESNEVDTGSDENKAPGELIEEKLPEKKEEPTNPTPKRGRVPPGGFSSALW